MPPPAPPPTRRAETYSERTAIAAEYTRRLSSRASRFALAPRDFTLTVRFVLTLLMTIVAFAPALSANFFAVVDGSPTVYLVLLPMWAVMIGYGIDKNSLGRVINDKELDWIAALAIGVVVTACTYLSIPRLLASATLLHIELMPILAWFFCGCILNYGARRSFRGWRILVFAIICFPGTIVIASAQLGGTPLAYSLVIAALNCIAVRLALSNRPHRWLLSLGTAVCTFLGAVVLTPLSPTVGLLLPSVVTSLSVAVYAFRHVRTHKPAHLAMPQRSLVSVVAFGAVAVTALVVLPDPATRVREHSMVTASSDWLDRLQDSSEFNVSETARFDWAPNFLGADGSAVRYELDSAADADEVLFLDVFTAESAGVLANFKGAIWYATNPPARVSDELFEFDNGVTATGSTNGADQIRSPKDPLWAALGWTWKTHNANQSTVFQRMYLMTSKRADQPRNVPLPQEPTFQGTALAPISWLARSQDNGVPAESNDYLNGLADTLHWIFSDGYVDG